MSSATHNEQWKSAMTDLVDQIEAEAPEDPSRLSKEPTEVFQQQATLYVKYIQILRRLEDSYDQIVHPQKRIDLKKIMENVIGRILEIKEVLLKIELTDYIRLDDLLVDLKLTPEVLEMPVPRYFVDDRAKELEEREKLLDALTAQYRSGEVTEEADENTMSIEDAICIIQVNERGRQGRQRARLMKEIRRQEERERRAMEFGETAIDPHNAAVAIQKAWRGYAARQLTRRMREEEAVFIGMTRVPMDSSKDPKTKAEQTRAHRKLVQAQNEQEYQQALVTIKQKLYELEGPDMKENMMDSIRSWFIAYREQHGKFPDFPTETDGGSAAIFKEPEPEPEPEPEANKRDAAKSRLGSRKGPSPTKRAGGKGKKGDEPETEVIEVPVSKYLQNIQEAANEYRRVWQFRDESNNFSQKYDTELVKDQLRPEVEADIRSQVDELLRTELDNLKMAVERDKKKKKKGGKKGGGSGAGAGGQKKKKKAKKGGGGGGGGGGRKKKKKDLTADRSIESLYAELVLHNIIRKYNKNHIRDYLGETNLLGSTLRDASIEVDPSMADVRRVVTEYCVLPLGCEPLHKDGPPIKSVLFYGPRQSGKTTMAHAVAAETGSNFFDLSPAVIAGKFGGRAITMCLHTVFKVAKVLAPSVIYIDNFERVFASERRRRDPGDNPSRMKKDLIKEVKALTPDDRVLVIGNSRRPWDGDFRAMMSFVSKAFYFPRPDYSSRRLIWTHLVESKVAGLGQSLNLQILAHVSEGYTAGMISSAVSKVLNAPRIKKLGRRPITTEEFIVPLARIEPVYVQEDEEFRKWTAKLPLSKARKKKLSGDEEDDQKKDNKGRSTTAKGGKRS